MTAKALPPVATKIPSKLYWDLNASTGNYIARLNPATRLVRSGRDGNFLYRAEYWGDYSSDFPIGSNALTASKALEDLKKDVAKLKRGTPSLRHHATRKSPAQQREIDPARWFYHVESKDSRIALHPLQGRDRQDLEAAKTAAQQAANQHRQQFCVYKIGTGQVAKPIACLHPARKRAQQLEAEIAAALKRDR